MTGIAISGDDTMACVVEHGVARSGDGGLAIISLAEYRVVRTIALPDQPNAVTVTADGC